MANIATAITSKYDASSIASAPVGFAAGTVSLPGVYLGPDTTTGLYRVAANSVGLTVSGSNALTVNSSGLTVANAVTINGGGTGLTVANNVTISGALTVSTSGTSLKGAVSIAVPASSVVSLTVNSINGQYSQEWADGTHTLGLFMGTNSGIGSISTHPFVLFANNGAPAFQVTTAGLPQAVDDGGTMQTVGWRGTPTNVQNTNYTLQLSDRGKAVVMSGSSNFTYTVPSAVFSGGDVVAVYNFGGAGNTVTIAGSGVTLFWANGTQTSGSRTLTAVGVATISFIDATHAIVSGSSLS